LKRATVILIIFLLCLFLVAGNVSSFLMPKLNISNRLQDFSDNINDISQCNQDDFLNDFLFEPIDIELKDDAFHKSRGLYSYEWWYFDASLDNGYSIQLSIRVINVVNKNLFTIGLNVYKDGDLVSNNQKIYLKEQIFASTIEPIIIIDGKEVMRGYIDESTGDWTYLINFEIDDISIDFQYVGETKGWKGLTPGIGWWAVVLPRAEVIGTLRINDIDLYASGTGYHDHNWDVKVAASVNFGWLWGKIDSSTHTITWADVKITRISEDPFIVINKKDGEYINIPTNSISLVPTNLRFNNGKFIPNSFILIVDDEDVQINIEMEVLETHHIRKFGFINYWRYHLHCAGDITIDGQTEIIDQNSIAEFVRFR